MPLPGITSFGTTWGGEIRLRTQKKWQTVGINMQGWVCQVVYVPSTWQNWLNEIRQAKQDASPYSNSSYTFYCKKVWVWTAKKEHDQKQNAAEENSLKMSYTWFSMRSTTWTQNPRTRTPHASDLEFSPAGNLHKCEKVIPTPQIVHPRTLEKYIQDDLFCIRKGFGARYL